MSFFNRDRQPRENMWVMVAKGEAKDILETYSALEKTSAQTVGFLTRIKTGYAVRNYELSQMWASRGVQPAVSAVEVKDAGVIREWDRRRSPRLTNRWSSPARRY